jgi:hypothetical protein
MRYCAAYLPLGEGALASPLWLPVVAEPEAASEDFFALAFFFLVVFFALGLASAPVSEPAAAGVSADVPDDEPVALDPALPDVLPPVDDEPEEPEVPP